MKVRSENGSRRVDEAGTWRELSVPEPPPFGSGPRVVWALRPVLGEELEPDGAGRAGFSAPIVGKLINDIETQSSEVVRFESWLDGLEVSCRPRLFYLDS